ncbi:Eukaryotic translation initiation factor 4B2 [Glycine soja]
MCLTSFRTVRLLKTQPLTMSISEESNQLIQQQISRRHTTRQLSDIMQTRLESYLLARSEVGDEGQLWKEISQEVYKDADKLFKMIGEAYTALSDPAQGTKGRGARSTANGGSIPSLKEVVNSKPKKKGTSITLSEFNRGGFNQGLTREEMLAFPTNPKKHSVKEMQFNTLATVSPSMITLTDARVIATAATTKVRGGGGDKRSYNGLKNTLG